ncbi:MAG: hypothetical protein ACLP9L_04835 [Thermoguttaceae bacterium]
MFNLIARWRKQRRLAAMLKAGAVFSYWDGQRVRHADPFKLWRELTQDPDVNLERLLPEVDAADGKAIDTAIAHVCKVFAVTRWDETAQTGLTDLELLNLLGGVLRWTAFVKKNSSPGQTSPPVTAPASSIGPEPPSATKSVCGACTSTATDSKPARPTTCCGQSATPSAARS